MRILHTSDWHIGRTFHGHSTLDALRGVLDALVAQVGSGVDVVIVAGDVFDSATPAAAGVLSDTLAALADAGAEVIVTSGNHDPLRASGSSRRPAPRHPRADRSGEVGTPITVRDEHGPVHVYGIPFLEPRFCGTSGRECAHRRARSRTRWTSSVPISRARE
jgi:exonuclease SbcD